MAWNKPKDNKHVTESGNIIDRRYSAHPDFNPARKPYKWKTPRHKSPNSISYIHWMFLLEWVPTQIEQGNVIDRQAVADICHVTVSTVTCRNWLNVLYDHFEGQFEWEIDPVYTGKRGRRVMRLVPKK